MYNRGTDGIIHIYIGAKTRREIQLLAEAAGFPPEKDEMRVKM